jgi:protein subunit release factor B
VSYRPPYVDPNAIVVVAPHPATIEEETLLEQCELELGRRRGPGGQHRAAVASGVHLLHRPTGIEAQATERRSPQVNRRMAIFRLRLRLALKVRTAT